MKRIASMSLLLILVALFAVPQFDAAAQGAQLKRIGRSLNSFLPATGKWSISNGLRAVGVGSKTYWRVDTTGTGISGSPAWSIVSSPGSGSALDSTGGQLINSLSPNATGEYVISVTIGSSTLYDTITASTYYGVGADAQAGCFCHNGTFAPGDASQIKASWMKTGHAQIFTQGITGQLEVDAVVNKGVYTKTCVQCHTVGWEPSANNGNFGYASHIYPAASPNSWDSTWFVGLPLSADGRDLMITYQDSTIWKNLPPELQPLGYIGCESCHGPSITHKLTTSKLAIGKSLDADLCNMCHDGSTRHTIGSYYNLSAHAAVTNSTPPTGHATSSGCTPCHSGKSFVYYLDHNRDMSGLAAVWDNSFVGSAISCAVCHDPHGSDNPFQLRTASIDTLRNGYAVPAGMGGLGQLCAYCHSGRYTVKQRVTTKAPYYGFTDRYGPHVNPQADMYYGTNGYEYGDTNLVGIGTHHGLENGCVTCHMQDRVRITKGKSNNNPQASHSWSMSDTAFGFNAVAVCRTCHGDVADFSDVKASYDYDGNGVIEGVQTEVQGLLNRLKARLPIDASTGDVISMMKDSLAIKNRPDLVQAIWNYWFVTNDKSMGVHNTKYAVSLLQKSLGIYPLDVKKNEMGVPKEFALNQNYPNPFNPTTNISFALPKSGFVKLDVYDMLGQRVKTIVNTVMSAGNFTVTWDGLDQNGARVSSGMYFYRLDAGSYSAVKKMLLLK